MDYPPLSELDRAAMTPETFVNPAVSSFLGSLGAAAKKFTMTPGQIMTKNPYPVGSEEYDYFENTRSKAMQDFSGDAALATMGTGAIAGVPLRAGEQALGAGLIRAYHGSPHEFDKFDIRRIGSGEGAQVYSHGLYFGQAEETAKTYRDALARRQGLLYEGKSVDQDTPYFVRSAMEWLKDTARPGDTPKSLIDRRILQLQDHAQFMRGMKSRADQQAATMYDNAVKNLQGLDPDKVSIPKGHMYEVNIHADPKQLLDWDAPISEQGEAVKSIARGQPGGMMIDPKTWDTRYTAQPITGSDLIAALREKNTPEEIAGILKGEGIPGVQYLDQFSRGRNSRQTILDNIEKTQRSLDAARWLSGPGVITRRADLQRELEGWRTQLRDLETNPPTRNYVVNDDQIIEIVRRYGLAGLLGTGALAGGENRQ